MADSTRTIAAEGSHEVIIRKSRFICSLGRVSSEEEGRSFLAEVRKRYWDANHNCSAWVIGSRGEFQRSNDDGEPAGTAGQPMLTALNHRNLTDVVAVVTRYFGGTLLGAGGLVRAYGQAVTQTVNQVGIVERRPMIVTVVDAPHELAGRLDYALRGSPFVAAAIDYAEKVRFEIHLGAEDVERFDHWLAETTGGQLVAENVGVKYVEVPVQDDATKPV